MLREIRFVRELVEKLALARGIDVKKICEMYGGMWLGREETCLMPHEEIKEEVSG